MYVRTRWIRLSISAFPIIALHHHPWWIQKPGIEPWGNRTIDRIYKHWTSVAVGIKWFFLIVRNSYDDLLFSVAILKSTSKIKLLKLISFLSVFLTSTQTNKIRSPWQTINLYKIRDNFRKNIKLSIARYCSIGKTIRGIAIAFLLSTTMTWHTVTFYRQMD